MERVSVTTILIFSSLLIIPLIIGAPDCTGSNIFRLVTSDECRTVWRCGRPGTEPLLIASCPEGSVLGEQFKCVKEGSSESICQARENCGFRINPCRNGGKCISGTKANEFDCQCKKPFTGRYCHIVPSPSDICAVSAKYSRIPDTEFCQTYYDCGDKSNKPELKECDYPLQFDTTTQTCRHYSSVYCGNRKNVKTQCQYNKYKSVGMNLYRNSPCQSVFPSCVGKPDGKQPQSTTGHTAKYMICKDERLVSTGYCPPTNMGPQIATKDGCKNAFEVTKEEGGLQPSCKGRVDGYYPLKNGSCQQYILCKADKTYIEQCPNALAFDSSLSRCNLKMNVCRPCGTKQC